MASTSFRLRVLSLTVLLSLCVIAGAQPKRPVTLNDFDRLQSAAWLELSPDGSDLVYAFANDLWIVSTTQGSIPRKLTGGTMPRLAPDGKRIAYVLSKVGMRPQLWLTSLDGRKAGELTSLSFGIRSVPPPTWSPDGRRILFTADVAREAVADPAKGVDPLVLTSKTPSGLTLRGILPSEGAVTDYRSPAAAQLFVVDVDSKEVRRLTDDDLSYAARSWSPDGRTIACAVAYPRNPVESAAPRLDVLTIDVATGKRNVLASPGLAVGHPLFEGVDGGPRWSPDGTRIAYMGPSSPYGHTTLFVVPAGGGVPRDVGVKLNRNVYGFEWTSDSGALIVNFLDQPTQTIARLDASTCAVAALTTTDALRRIMSTASQGTIAWQQNDETNPAVIWVKRTGGAAFPLVDLNPEIKNWLLGEQEVVRWRSTDGEELSGVLVKPLDYRAGRKYPVIVSPYGSMAAFNSFESVGMFPNQTHASRGYVLFYPQVRSYTNWPQSTKNLDFAKAVDGPRAGDVAVNDVLSGIDMLIERGIADPERLGLWGFSNGASTTNYLVTRTNRFKAAVSCGGVSDWLHYDLLTPADDQTRSDMFRGRTPWTDRETYIAASAVYHLEGVRTPLLLVAGDHDRQALGIIYMFNGLRRLGREVTLVRYSGEGHAFRSAALRDYDERVLHFFAEHLLK